MSSPTFTITTITPNDAQQALQSNGLDTLGLNGTMITDSGLDYLKGVKRLENLYLVDTQVTDAGLVHLKEPTRLWMLYLPFTRVTDAGLVHLRA